MADEETTEESKVTQTGSQHKNDEDRARGKTEQVDVQKGRRKSEEE